MFSNIVVELTAKNPADVLDSVIKAIITVIWMKLIILETKSLDLAGFSKIESVEEKRTSCLDAVLMLF